MKKTAIYGLLGSLLLAGGVLLFSAGRSAKPSTLTEYKVWFGNPDNGFLKERTVKNIRYSVQHRPAELMLLNELKAMPQATSATVQSLKESYGNSEYFLLQFGPNGEGPQQGDLLKNLANNIEDHAELYRDLAFDINTRVRLVVAGDTLEPTLSHYEQGYELSANQRFLFAFPTGDRSTEDMTFIYDDQLLEAGRLKFRFQENTIPTLPI